MPKYGAGAVSIRTFELSRWRGGQALLFEELPALNELLEALGQGLEDSVNKSAPFEQSAREAP